MDAPCLFWKEQHFQNNDMNHIPGVGRRQARIGGEDGEGGTFSCAGDLGRSEPDQGAACSRQGARVHLQRRLVLGRRCLGLCRTAHRICGRGMPQFFPDILTTNFFAM
jgi:hypothetical protein